MPNRKSGGVVVSAQLLEDALTSILVDPTKDTIEALIGGMMDEADKENRRRIEKRAGTLERDNSEFDLHRCRILFRHAICGA